MKYKFRASYKIQFSEKGGFSVFKRISSLPEISIFPIQGK